MAYVFLWVVGALALDPQGANIANNTNACSNSQGNTPPVLHVTNQSQQAIFWSSTAMAVLVSFVQGAITTLIDVCEAESLWTVRFRLAVFEHYWWIGIAVALLASFAAMVISFLAGNNNEALGVLVLATASSLVVFRYAWPAWRNRHFCENRWAAWTGPSRTGITSDLVDKVGDIKTWRSLRDNAMLAQYHPVDKTARWFLGIRSPLIDSDPTELLKASLRSASPAFTPAEKGHSSIFASFSRRKNDLETGVAHSPPQDEDQRTNAVTRLTLPLPLPSSHSSLPDAHEEPATNEQNPVPSLSVTRPLPSEGLFPPVNQGESASLLWGEHLGFSRRVSRGVICIPSRLLISQPVTDAGHNGRAMCLMHGIFGRNKGLAPWTFILELINVQKFEEKCAQWPRPSKVLRSYYQKEVEESYGGLGDAFVKAATEMALLLADTPSRIIKDWLEQVMEQQDLALARRAYQLGATDKELTILYRLSYATMLASLACHTYGRKKRPEITVFRAYYALNKDSLGPLPGWASSADMQTRANEEKDNVHSNADLEALVIALLLKKTSPPAGN